ncbi:MAG: hypothetical protein U0172_11470 [Nitrospiraceae bacterium]
MNDTRRGLTQRFNETDRAHLLRVKGVGPKVIERIEQMGISSMSQLAEANVRDLLVRGAQLSGSSCWKNSPQAKAAITSAIEAALNFVHQNHTSR